tara:strand:+ start:1672 stop:1989 length:318 start_codon:yes stop_codon:yes gene_type:complete
MIVDAGLREGSGISAMQTIEQQRTTQHIFVTGDLRRFQTPHPDAIILEKLYFEPQLVVAIEQSLCEPTAPSKGRSASGLECLSNKRLLLGRLPTSRFYYPLHPFE